jgi:hypothetical protein
MNTADDDRIHELEQRISEWDRENQQTIARRREAVDGMKGCLASSSRAAALASLPSMIWVAYWFLTRHLPGQFVKQTILILQAWLVLSLVVAGIARASGLVAHWWFRDSTSNERVAAGLIAAAGSIVLFGWILVLTWN